MHLCVLLGSQNKELFFLYTANLSNFITEEECLLRGTNWAFNLDRYSFVLKGLMLTALHLFMSTSHCDPTTVGGMSCCWRSLPVVTSRYRAVTAVSFTPFSWGVTEEELTRECDVQCSSLITRNIWSYISRRIVNIFYLWTVYETWAVSNKC